jgi:hypothetical protein
MQMGRQGLGQNCLFFSSGAVFDPCTHWDFPDFLFVLPHLRMPTFRHP